MLYSESDSEIRVQSELETISSEEDSADAQEMLAEAVADNREQKEYDHARAFFYIFEDPAGPFRRTFPEFYTKLGCEVTDLTAVLREVRDEEMGAGVGDEGHDTQHGASTTSSALPPAALESSCKEDNATEEDVVLKPSPATRFLDAHPGKCLLLSIDPSINRAELCKKHAEEYPGIDFYVGYTHSEPAGWALLLSVDPAIVAQMQILYPSHRFATDEDRRIFLKEQRAGKGGGAALPAQPSAWRPNRELSKRMRDVTELARLIEAVGGPQRAIFVALDVEAAVVLSGGIPLPLELALIPLGTEHELQTFHCFIHPGRVMDEVTAFALSSGVLKGSHFIPFRNASFLRRDYTEIARELIPFLANERVFFVNKGSTMDVHALRWVFGAASAVEGSEFPIPPLQDIYCFDIEAVSEVLSRDAADGGKSADGAAASCWYHDKMERALLEEAAPGHQVHCALRDAGRLYNQLRSLLEKCDSAQANAH
ncbi:uncharacterized protein Tco025E_01775 [Trypanosoma conorhini]|uniref:Uncharacterized protein n=1 Tax=Trypanosoma conorhini TaxID=83891 RepID=A0A422Q7P6_9TRYP|nr:uncharacterized protein Tco025E_01775 [Trypanosoma conorhini]RNF25988.1 hypothetical protein Tco025E_01775 [Trypanosoma conorhini]